MVLFVLGSRMAVVRLMFLIGLSNKSVPSLQGLKKATLGTVPRCLKGQGSTDSTRRTVNPALRCVCTATKDRTISQDVQT